MLNPKKTKKQRQYLRNNMSKWEIRLWNDLKQKKMYGYKVRRQYGVNNYILDFYCPQLKLGIEVDGKIHFEYGRSIHDQEKDNKLKELGIKIIRITTLDLEEDYNNCILHLEDIFSIEQKNNERLIKPPLNPLLTKEGNFQCFEDHKQNSLKLG